MQTTFDEILKRPEPCVLVIFGASGDLTHRKLIPALYNLAVTGDLPPHFVCVGFARRDKTDDMFREEARESIRLYSRTKPSDDSFIDQFIEKIFYHRSEFHDEAGYHSLKSRMEELDVRFGTRGNRIFTFQHLPAISL
jgi:Glucose-6-phosphate 1-dehydrogenase